MHALDVLGDPVRRRLLELLVDGERTSGDLASVITAEFGISQPAVSQHLRVLRESGVATVRPEATRRLYSVGTERMAEAEVWLRQFERVWRPRLDALGTEIARGTRARRTTAADTPDDPSDDPTDERTPT